VAVAKLLIGHLWQTRILGVEVAPGVASSGEPPSVVPDQSEETAPAEPE
jgi:hypothetical protein